MDEKFKEKIETFYQELLAIPLQVVGIFNDFYDEERVDFQPISLDEFIEEIEGYTMLELVRDVGHFTRTAYYKSQYKKGIDILSSWHSNKGHTLLHSEQIFEEFSPYMKEFIGNRFFNDMPIIIHFPHVTISNEYGRSVEVKNLWARVPVTWEGKGKGWFHMNRSEYDISHMEADYMH